MAINLNQTHPLLTVPINVDTDFTVPEEHAKPVQKAAVILIFLCLAK